MNHSIPASLPLEVLTDVSSAPHSRPLESITCCIRVSLLSSLYSDSLNLSGWPFSVLAQGVKLRQSTSGVEPTSWTDPDGTAYWPTPRTTCESVACGLLPCSESVLVSDHTSSWFDWRGPTPAPFPWASSAAFELRKNSVPLLAEELMSLAPIDGHSVNPEFPLSRPCVSNCVTLIRLELATSADFEKA